MMSLPPRLKELGGAVPSLLLKQIISVLLTSQLMTMRQQDVH